MSIALALIAISTFAETPLTSGRLEMVADKLMFTEGPLWLPGTGLIFSDIPADTIYRADKTVFRSPSGKSNGLTLDREGRLIVCDQWNQRVTRTEKDGAITVLADSYLGRKFNSPNDACVRSDGTIFFTDPPYGLEQRTPELPFCGVYAIQPDKKVILLSVYFRHPNGLAFSPDEKTLYVGDSGDNFIQAFDVVDDCRLANSRLFCKSPNPDGMKVDVDARLWTTAEDGVRVYDQAGTLLTTIAVPEMPSNCSFGDDDGKTLYITARTAVYKIRTTVRGITPGAR